MQVTINVYICCLWLIQVTIQAGWGDIYHISFDGVVCLECTSILCTSVRMLTCFQVVAECFHLFIMSIVSSWNPVFSYWNLSCRVKCCSAFWPQQTWQTWLAFVSQGWVLVLHYCRWQVFLWTIKWRTKQSDTPGWRVSKTSLAICT